jgi:GNAT superfamily N-acetyltransferase
MHSVQAVGPSLRPCLLVRKPQQSDINGLASLFAEMQSHYGRPVSEERAREAAALACRPRTTPFDPHVLLAVLGRVVVGSLVMNVTFPAFELSQSLYIRDLYVAAASRRHGVGQAMVRSAASLVLENGYSALEWTTDSTNAAARSMYENVGAERLERTYYRFFDEGLRDAAD